MFEVGFTEIILILGLALLVLGPEKLPGLVQKVGRWTGRARAMARQLRTQLEHEVTMEELTRSRPMQGPASESSAAATQAPPAPDESAVVDPASRSDPQPDLDTRVSGVEPHTPAAEAGTPEHDEAAAANSKQ